MPAGNHMAWAPRPKAVVVLRLPASAELEAGIGRFADDDPNLHVVGADLQASDWDYGSELDALERQPTS